MVPAQNDASGVSVLVLCTDYICVNDTCPNYATPKDEYTQIFGGHAEHRDAHMSRAPHEDVLLVSRAQETEVQVSLFLVSRSLGLSVASIETC